MRNGENGRISAVITQKTHWRMSHDGSPSRTRLLKTGKEPMMVEMGPRSTILGVRSKSCTSFNLSRAMLRARAGLGEVVKTLVSVQRIKTGEGGKKSGVHLRDLRGAAKEKEATGVGIDPRPIRRAGIIRG